MGKNLRALLPVLLIIAAGIIVYANSLSGKFIWDDEMLLIVRSNITPQELLSPAKLFAKDIQKIGLGAIKQYFFYRPLQVLSYIWDYSFWNFNPAGYHLTNIVLHILAGLCLYWLINLLYKDRIVSLFASLLFVVHPIHTEAVSYISGRADPMATLFVLLAIIFYVKYTRSPSVVLFTVILISYFLALISRENALILPLLLILYHYAFGEKARRGPLIAVFSLALVYILMRLTSLKTILPHLSAGTTFLERLPGFFAAITVYVRLLFLPINLHMEYGNMIFTFSDPIAILGVVIFISLLLCLFINRKNRFIFFSLSWFIITLLPQSNLYPLPSYMAEHWLYMPSIGFFILAGTLLSRLYEKRALKMLGIIAIAGLVAFYAYLTVNQNRYWHDPITFYKTTLQYVKNSPRIYTNLATIYSRNGDYNKAIPLYKKAIELDPKFVIAYSNLGIAYYNIGETDNAINTLLKAIEISPSSPDAYNNLGDIYNKMGRYDDAIAMFRRSFELNPGAMDICHNLARALIRAGRPSESIPLLEKVLSVNPHNGAAHSDLATAYYYTGQYGLSIKHCDDALAVGQKIDPRLLELLKPYRK